MKKSRKNTPTQGYFIIVGSGKPLAVTGGYRRAIDKAWEISETTDKLVRVVKLVAKFKSGAKINRRTLRPVRRKKKK